MKEKPLTIHERLHTVKQQVVELSKRTGETYDPLHANAFFEHLPERRKSGSLGMSAIRLHARELVAKSYGLNLDNLTSEQAIAVHRDLAMAINVSVLPTEDGETPNVNAIIPSGEDALLRLAAKTGFAPRLTDPLYVSGNNTRRFTDRKMNIVLDGITHEVYAEDVFKAAVNEGLSRQKGAIDAIMSASILPISDKTLPNLLGKARDELSGMRIGIALLREPGNQLPLEWFSQELLPLLMPYKIGAMEYIHSGSQMTHMYFADELLWAADGVDATYSDFREKNLAYATSANKDAFAKLQENMHGKGSVVTQTTDQIKRDLQETGKISDETLQSSLAILQLMQEVAKFRVPHMASIRGSLPYRRNRESTGGDIDMPAILLERITRQQERLKEALNAKVVA